MSKNHRYDFMDLLFFAYRDFVGDPDNLLEDYGFGRAHHRVLYFVYRNPGITVNALLAILKITKQSLSRVLRQLMDGDYIDQRTDGNDRRQRHLFVTRKGADLAEKLADIQTTRIEAALQNCPGDAEKSAKHFLAAMINEEDRARVMNWLSEEPHQ